MRHTSRALRMFILVAFCSLTAAAQTATMNREQYLSWTAKQATDIGKKWRVAGRIGWELTFLRLTSKTYFYELRATLMSPEAIRAAARLEQLRRHLTDAETRELVITAEKTDGLVVFIEINPREGSGVIPLDWRSTLQPKGAPEGSPLAIAGASVPALRHVRALTRVGPRDYAYEVFWVVFPMKDHQGKPIWTTAPNEIELVVGIYEKQGRVSWLVSDALRERLMNLKQ